MTIFQSWEELLRIATTAVVVYSALILFTRILGKRSTSKMNNFDWVVTVALGSITGSVILLKDVVLLDGLVAILILLLLQYTSTRLSLSVPLVKRALHASPTLLFYRGRFLDHAICRERVLESEILAAVREQGHARLADVVAVVLEADANLSVVARGPRAEPAVFSDVEGFSSEFAAGAELQTAQSPPPTS